MGKAAVTGVRDLPGGGAERISEFLAGLTKAPQEITTGAQFGADTVAAETALALWEETVHRIVVPAHRHNHDVVALARRMGRKRGVKVDVVHMEEGTTYLHRNDRMLDYATYLIAFPLSRKEVQRSGTWHCIRSARSRNLPIILVPLDGDKPYKIGVPDA